MVTWGAKTIEFLSKNLWLLAIAHDQYKQRKKISNDKLFFSYNKTIATRTKELEPGFRRSKMAEIRRTRTQHVVTFNPNRASPGEEIYIDKPKLKPDTCLVPDSLNLQFDFKNANAKSWFLNNLSKLLCERFVVKFAGEVVYDNTGESVLSVYKDLWKTQ